MLVTTLPRNWLESHTVTANPFESRRPKSLSRGLSVLSLAEMISGANAFKISDHQLNWAIPGVTECNNVRCPGNWAN
jgi:hypothetical protein